MSYQRIYYSLFVYLNQCTLLIYVPKRTLLFKCREWTEAIMLFRYDLKNSDVKCTAVFLISLI